MGNPREMAWMPWRGDHWYGPGGGHRPTQEAAGVGGSEQTNGGQVRGCWELQAGPPYSKGHGPGRRAESWAQHRLRGLGLGDKVRLGGGPRYSLGQRRGAVFCLGRPGCEPCCGPQLLVRPVWPWGRHQAGEVHPPAVEASLDPKTLWRPLRIRPLCSQLFKTGQVTPQVTLEAQPDVEGPGVRVKLARSWGAGTAR